MLRSLTACLAAAVLVVAATSCDPQGDEVKKATNSCFGSSTVCLDLEVFWNVQQCGGRQFIKETRLTYRWRQMDSQFTVRNARGKLGYVALIGCDGKVGSGEVRDFSRATPVAGQWYQINALSSFEYHTNAVDWEASGAWAAGDVYRSGTKKGTVCVQQLWRDNGGDACMAL